jgi:uncharacterized protein (DUF302 family)
MAKFIKLINDEGTTVLVNINKIEFVVLKDEKDDDCNTLVFAGGEAVCTEMDPDELESLLVNSLNQERADKIKKLAEDIIKQIKEA